MPESSVLPTSDELPEATKGKRLELCPASSAVHLLNSLKRQVTSRKPPKRTGLQSNSTKPTIPSGEDPSQSRDITYLIPAATIPDRISDPVSFYKLNPVHCYHYLGPTQERMDYAFIWYLRIDEQICLHQGVRSIAIDTQRIKMMKNTSQSHKKSDTTTHPLPSETPVESLPSYHLRKSGFSFLPTVYDYIKAFITMQNFTSTEALKNPKCQCPFCMVPFDGQESHDSLLLHLFNDCAKFNFRCTNCQTHFSHWSNYIQHLDGKRHTLTPTTKSHHNSGGDQDRFRRSSLTDGLQQRSIQREGSVLGAIAPGEVTSNSTCASGSKGHRYNFENNLSTNPGDIKRIQEGVAPSGFRTTFERIHKDYAAKVKYLEERIESLQGEEAASNFIRWRIYWLMAKQRETVD